MRSKAMFPVFLLLLPLIFSSCGGRPAEDTTSSKWSDISVKDDQIKFIAVNRKAPGALFAFSQKGIYSTFDYGSAWEANTDKFFKKNEVLKADSDINGTLYILVKVNDNGEGKLIRYTDNGATLTTLADPKTLPLPVKRGDRGGIYTFRVHPRQPANIFIAGFAQASLLSSTDGGKTWKLLDAGLKGTENFSFAEYDFDNPDIMYFEEGKGPVSEGVDQSRVYGSKDKGATWQLLFEKAKGEGRISSMAPIPGSGTAIFGFKRRGVDIAESIRTSPATWEKGEVIAKSTKGFGGKICDLVSDKDGNIYAHFVDEASRVMFSRDGGATWSDLKAPLKPNSECILQLALDPENPDALYILVQELTTNATKILLLKK